MNDGALSDPWLALAVAIFVLAVLALALFARREKRPAASTDAKLDALDRRLGAAEKKWAETDHDVRGIRMIVANLPTKDSIAALSERVAESGGQISGMQHTLQSQSRSLDRIEDFLMRASVDHIVGKPREHGDGETR